MTSAKLTHYLLFVVWHEVIKKSLCHTASMAPRRRLRSRSANRRLRPRSCLRTKDVPVSVTPPPLRLCAELVCLADMARQVSSLVSSGSNLCALTEISNSCLGSAGKHAHLVGVRRVRVCTKFNGSNACAEVSDSKPGVAKCVKKIPLDQEITQNLAN